MSELAHLTIVEILAGFRSRRFSPLDYWLGVEDRIAAWEPSIRAFYGYDPEAARQQARDSTERWAKGAPRGPLEGIPVSLKELIATKGLPVPHGTNAQDITPADADAPVAARLREDGAILFAKTTCPDFGMLSSGLSSFHGVTRNPWNLSQNTGGSSSGAGAAAAAGCGPLHIGTDIGGSVRLPAGWCGVFGFKPSLGRIPLDPYYLGRCGGPMTRCVSDAAAAMATLSRPDWRDATSLPPNDFDWLDLSLAVPGLRIGLMMDAGCGLPLDPQIRDAVGAAARRLEGAGAEIVEVAPVLDHAMLEGLDHFWRARLWEEILTIPPERRDQMLPYILQWAEGGAGVSGVAAVHGFNQTLAMRAACAQLFQGLDAVISPTNNVLSFPADWASPTNDPARPFEHIVFTVPWNMSEQPAASIHCGFSQEGMPIGLQIVGPRFADTFVLKLARAYEELRGPMALWPSPPG